jgi:hypothetical protein
MDTELDMRLAAALISKRREALFAAQLKRSLWLLKLVHRDAVLMRLAPASASAEALHDWAASELERVLSACDADYTWDDLAPQTALWIVDPQNERLPPLHARRDDGVTAVPDDRTAEQQLHDRGYCLTWWAADAAPKTALWIVDI